MNIPLYNYHAMAVTLFITAFAVFVTNIIIGWLLLNKYRMFCAFLFIYNAYVTAILMTIAALLYPIK